MTFLQSRYHSTGRWLFAALALFLLAGCGGEYKMGEAVPESADRYSAPAAAGESRNKGEAKPEAPGRYMAYEHWLRLEVNEDRVRPLYDTALAACRDAAAEQCTVLDSEISTGSGASARLRLRARAAGIKKILAVLTEKGGVVSQSTSAEDLARPIADNSRKLDMLRDYRARLEALRGRAASNIESLVKVNKELAQVQSDIEALSGEQARLVQRVETEILNVSVSSEEGRPFWRPIGRALSRFGGNLADGISSAITAVAYIIPWSLILLALAWVARRLWRRMRRGR